MEIIVREVAVRGEGRQTGSLVGKCSQHARGAVMKMQTGEQNESRLHIKKRVPAFGERHTKRNAGF